jgi:competence protein ComEC
MFWVALTAGAAVLLAEEREPALWFWAALLLAGAALALFRLHALGAVIAVAALFGLRAGQALHPTVDPPLPTGTVVSVRGVLEGTPGHVSEKRATLALNWRHTTTGWRAQSGRVGLIAPPRTDVGDELWITGRLVTPPPATGPGAISERLGWLRRGARVVLRFRPEAAVRVGHHPLPAWRQGALNLRKQILEANRRTLTPLAAALVNDFLIGDSAPPDPELSEQIAEVFRSSGVIHLLVVSGTQVTLVLGLFLWLGWRVRPARWLFWTLGAAAVYGYALLTDGAAPVGRAVVMGLAMLAALALEREVDGENTLGLAALMLLAAEPLALFDLGFQLSFAALWGLLRLAPPLHAALSPPRTTVARMPRMLLWAWNVLAAAVAGSVAAHLAVAPLLAWHFQTSTWSGILANLPMLVMAALLLPVSITHTLLAVAGHTWIAPVVEFGAVCMLGGANFFAEPPFGTGGVFPPPVWLLPLLLVGVAVPSWVRGARLPALALTSLLVVILFLSERVPAPSPSVPTIRALDVGQGDAILLQSPGGGTVLVDTGPPRLGGGGHPVARALRALRVPTLDVVVATHPHADHVGGLAEVLQEFPVGLLLHNGSSTHQSEVWAKVVATAASHQTPALTPPPGHRLLVRDAALTVLGPRAGQTSPGIRDEENERSLVLRWDCNNLRVLLPGDAEAGAETQLLTWGNELRADVLKVGHHGSDGATTAAWLTAVRPRLVLLSCGQGNRFGHPGQGTLERFQAAGVVVGRTDREGTLTVEGEAGQLTLTPWLARSAAYPSGR